ncbi:hypothetical protein FJ434_20580 [Mesorhizobium sp. B2-5-13]|uniref:hypothetical protein n=1 Tax=unclassified Mesorhizobium TaxID=325217 RepID=UPI00112CF8C9|nr:MULTISPECIES: hypothetical protein [unclassified Mesorhizobium]TPJ81898.1 hypothetical protein FJ434_20580 [Mesorhizobium sp. B2-5-13]TPK45928.1 hypothetical protein FJ560_20355 [Mesorhizobium sp. B2-5-5]
MSAHTIFEHAPLGAIVAWSDATPRPPERHRRKFDAWKTNNSQGRLVRKQGALGDGLSDPHASFTLHEADYGAGGVIAIRVHRTFSLTSSLRFTIVERPAVGSVRVFDRTGDHAELVHLAQHRAAAEHWLSEHGYPNAVLEEVSPDEAAAAAVEGRVAA